MKRILGLTIWLVFLAWGVQAQTQRPVVINLSGGAMPQDSLDNKMQKGDSSVTVGVAGYYVTPTQAFAPSTTITHSGATPYVFTGTVTKGLNFAGVTPSFTDADNAWIAMGTWNDAITISSQTEHFVPLQIHLTSNTSIAKDIAAARFKVTTAAANTLTNVNVLELRSDIGHNIGSATGLSMSTNISGNTTTGAIGLLGGYFSFSGSGNVTSATSAPAVLLATSTATGTGIVNVGQFTVNASSNGVTNVLKSENIQGTATTLIDATNTGGTVTNGIKLTGTMTKGIDFSGLVTSAGADNPFIAMGTWNTPIQKTSQSEHFVPLQINLRSKTSVAKDIAAARFRVNTDTAGGIANTLTAVNVLEQRSKLEVDVGSHANLQVSTEVSENISCTGDLLVGYFSLQGDGNITSSNHVNVLEATNTHTGTGVDNVAHFTNNGGTVTNILKLANVNTSTSTYALGIYKSSSATPVFAVDTNGVDAVQHDIVAGIDSFTTTGTTKAITITGALATDYYIIQPVNPNYSTAIDTAFYSYTPAAGSVTVNRAAGGWAGATLKSGAQFIWRRFKTQ